MELQTLKYFCTVAEEGSLSKAAEKLHYAQPNLSTKMTGLEQDMGAPLFYRNSRGVILTPKGELLLKYATNLINLAEEATIAVRDTGEARGVLRIGSMESTVISYLSNLLVKFRKKNPQITFCVETGTSAYLLQRVTDHKIDGAFIANGGGNAECFCKRVKTEKLVLAVSNTLVPANPSLDEVLSLPLLVFPKGCSYRRALEHFIVDSGKKLPQIYEFTTLNAIFASCTSGLGVMLFPKNCIEQYSLSKTLMVLDVPDKYSMIATSFVYRKDTYLSSALCSFINAIGAIG